jgi:hypothetical protein
VHPPHGTPTITGMAIHQQFSASGLASRAMGMRALSVLMATSVAGRGLMAMAGAAMAVAACLTAMPVLLASGALAQNACLTSEQMRDAVGAGHAVTAAIATRAARGASEGEVVRVRLCREAQGKDDQKLVYRITMLHRDGRVGHVTVDGTSGKIADVR